MGVDWGWDHPTALVITQTDGERYRVLEVYSWRQTDFDKIHDFIEQKAKQYKVYRIFCDLAFKGENLRLKKRGLPVVEVAFSKERALMQSRLRDLFVKGNIKIPDEKYTEIQELLMELRTATWIKKEGQDRLDALMLATKDIGSVSSKQFKIFTAKPRRRALYGSKRVI